MPCVHRNKFHHSLRNVNISSKTHGYTLEAFWSYQSIVRNSEKDESNNNNNKVHLSIPFFCVGAQTNLPEPPHPARPGSLRRKRSLVTSRELHWGHSTRMGPSCTFLVPLPKEWHPTDAQEHLAFAYGLMKAVAQINCLWRWELWPSLWARN